MIYWGYYYCLHWPQQAQVEVPPVPLDVPRIVRRLLWRIRAETPICECLVLTRATPASGVEKAHVKGRRRGAWGQRRGHGGRSSPAAAAPRHLRVC